MMRSVDCLRIAARKSPLARIQAESVGKLLEDCHSGLRCEIVALATRGDDRLGVPLKALGGKGVFTREIDQAVLAGRADLAVHSLKDLPADDPDGLTLAGSPKRASWRDVIAGFPGSGLSDVPPGSGLGCGSARRRAQLARARPDLVFHEVRGNIHTRLARAENNGWAGVVMARAALERLGLAIPFADIGEIVLPAAGQGALGLVVRKDSLETLEAVRMILHGPTTQAVLAERAFWRRLGAGCHAAAAALARPVDDSGESYFLEGRVLSRDGTSLLAGRREFIRDEGEAAGQMLAMELLAKGAGEPPFSFQ
ncbi:MAG: hydroxymethylbilane synthase [Planctomycetota bacterium]|nr:hydroxymethylbilane synthase [Planctomycetota bacterium]